ncbi:MAG TPA: hypothetical protein VFX15_10400 [Actinomycetes bacterium]|nr:hypothetical protein [Actinomycetes bacterium]
MASRMRWATRVGVAALAVGVAAPAAWAAVAWTPAANGGTTDGQAFGAANWAYGGNFEKSANGSVWAALTTDKIGNTWASDAGPYQGIYVRKGTVDPATGATTWAKAKRVSPGKKHGEAGSLSTGGSNNNVYTTWLTWKSYDNYDVTDPRQAQFRALVGGTWQPVVNLTSGKSTRVDYPVVAGSGNTVLVAYTNANNGNIVVRRSIDAGVTWGSTNAGTTNRLDPDDSAAGFAGWPTICADGAGAVVSWVSNNQINIRTSNDGGATWRPTVSVGTSAGADRGWSQCDVEGNRIGLAWNENDGVKYAEYSVATGNATTAAKTVIALPSTLDGTTFNAAYAVAPALTGAGTVGIAAPLCVQNGCDYNDKATRIHLYWTESTNNGGSFNTPTVLAQPTSANKKNLNDSPAPMYYDSDTRLVMYNGYNAAYTNYRLYLARGNGTP